MRDGSGRFAGAKQEPSRAGREAVVLVGIRQRGASGQRTAASKPNPIRPPTTVSTSHQANLALRTSRIVTLTAHRLTNQTPDRKDRHDVRIGEGAGIVEGPPRLATADPVAEHISPQIARSACSKNQASGRDRPWTLLKTLPQTLPLVGADIRAGQGEVLILARPHEQGDVEYKQRTTRCSGRCPDRICHRDTDAKRQQCHAG